MKKIFALLTLATIISISGKGQATTEKTKIYDKYFKWTITIPSGFDAVSAEQWAKLQNRGDDVIEKIYGEKVENYAKTIFAFKSDEYNYFEATYQPFDSTQDGNYLEALNSVNGITYNIFKAQIKEAKFDSLSSTAIIDGLTFQTFKLVINVKDKLIINLLMFSRLFEKQEFTVNIMTIDKLKEKELLESWTNSKFDK